MYTYNGTLWGSGSYLFIFIYFFVLHFSVSSSSTRLLLHLYTRSCASACLYSFFRIVWQSEKDIESYKIESKTEGMESNIRNILYIVRVYVFFLYPYKKERRLFTIIYVYIIYYLSRVASYSQEWAIILCIVASTMREERNI